MKIIFSPSKEMRNKNILKDIKQIEKPLFQENTLNLLNKLKKYSLDEIASIMKIKGTILENTFENIKSYENIEEIPALSLYNGVAFKELDIKNYSDRNLNFIQDRLYILSAFYGISKPFTLLKKYRLDMTMKIFDISLYEFWKNEINEFLIKKLNNDNFPVLINLASSEFFKIIDKKRIKNIINIDFKEFKDNKYVSISSYSKQARGQFLNIIIKKEIDNIEELKKIEFNNYKLNLELSNNTNFIFTR